MDRFKVLDDAVVDMLICCREHRTMVRLFQIALEGYPEEREHLLEVLDMIEAGSGQLEEAVHKVGKSMQELVAQES